MSEAFMPTEEGAPQGMPPAAPMPPELATAMGGGPGGADTAIPPELAAALGGGAGGPGGAEPPMEPATLEAAMEHFRMGIQMLQELQVSSEDDMEMADLGGIMGPVQKMLADRQKKEIVKSANG